MPRTSHRLPTSIYLACTCLLLALAAAQFAPLSAAAQGAAGAPGSKDFIEAVKQYNGKDYEGALKKFSALVQSQPNSADAFYYLGSCCQQTGRLQDAQRYYQYVVLRFPGTRAAQYAKPALDALEKSGVNVVGAATKEPEAAKDDKTKELERILKGTDAEVGELQGPDEDRVPVHRNRSGHMEATVTVNGRTIDMIYDTGASGTCISLAAWKRLGNAAPTRNPDAFSSGVGGTDPFWLEPVTFGMGKFTRKMKVMVLKSLPMDGLIGQTFFKDMQYNLSSSANYIHLLRKESRTAARSVPFNTIDIPFTRIGNNMYVDAKIEGRPIQMVFDTGASTTLVSSMQAGMMGLHPTGDYYVGGVSGVGGSRSAIAFHVDNISLGSVEKRNFLITVSNSGVSLLGMDFLGDRRYVIDNEKSMIRFFR